LWWTSTFLEGPDHPHAACWAAGTRIEVDTRFFEEKLLPIALRERWWRCHLEAFSSSSQGRGLVSTRQEAIMAQPDKSWRQDMQAEPSEEFRSREAHQSLFAVFAVILPHNADLPVLDQLDAMIGNRDAMGVAAQVFQ
jgi:hypothetical protein